MAHAAALTERHSRWEGLWRLADPKITLASAASLLLGAAAAAADGPLAWNWLSLTVLGVFLVEVAKNASGEIFDFDSGTDQAVAAEDRTPFSGGKRVIVDGLLSRGVTAAVAAICYIGASAVGGMIVFGREPRVLWLGALGVACAFFYHAPPLRLAYRGWGEVVVALCYGPLIAGGTFLVQRGNMDPRLALLSVPLGLLIGAFLLINEFPDRRADQAAGKRTLVVKLGPRRASRLFAGVVASAFAIVLFAPAAGLPAAVWLGLIGLPFGFAASHRLGAHPTTTWRIVPAQVWTLSSFVAMAIGCALGLVLG